MILYQAGNENASGSTVAVAYLSEAAWGQCKKATFAANGAVHSGMNAEKKSDLQPSCHNDRATKLYESSHLSSSPIP